MSLVEALMLEHSLESLKLAKCQIFSSRYVNTLKFLIHFYLRFQLLLGLSNRDCSKNESCYITASLLTLRES